MPPEKHALLSASSAARWLNCTAAPRFEEGLPESTSEYAEEGRLAHAIAELKTLKKFTLMTSRTYTTRLNKLKKEPLYNPEMDKTTDLYMEHLTEQAMLYDSAPTVAAEVKVDFNDYVPEGFGTCDNVMIGGDTLSITDYKHGKGVPVSAVGNPQMRLYALGALKRYAPIFGDTIKKVRMSIDQPRLDSYTTDIITVEELKAWGDSIKPIAQKAFSGLGDFVPGEHCRFCRGKAQCRARADVNTALEDFKGCVPASSVPADSLVPQEFSHIGPHGNEVHPLLSDAEIGDLLIRGQQLVQWYKDLEEYGKDFYDTFKSITVDNGCEFADYEGLERSCRRKQKRTKLYYCHPYSPHERGSNENMNRIIRRFFPKGTNFDEVQLCEVRVAEEWMNNYPRKILGWKSANQVMQEYLQTA